MNKTDLEFLVTVCRELAKKQNDAAQKRASQIFQFSDPDSRMWDAQAMSDYEDYLRSVFESMDSHEQDPRFFRGA